MPSISISNDLIDQATLPPSSRFAAGATLAFIDDDGTNGTSNDPSNDGVQRVAIAQEQTAAQTLLTALDKAEMNSASQTGSLTATPNLQTRYVGLDPSSETAVFTPGVAVTGLTGVNTEFADISTASLAITAIAPSVFIRTGDGNDVIAGTLGRAILDAGAGSNTLTGSAGQTTFLMDAQSSVVSAGSSVPASVVDTINNLKSGDTAIVRNVSLADYKLSLSDVTLGTTTSLQIMAAGNAGNSVQINLSGYSNASVQSNKLDISFGVDNAAGGTSYMLIHANAQ